MGRFLPPFLRFSNLNPKLWSQKTIKNEKSRVSGILPQSPYPRGRSFSPKITERAKPATKKSDLQILEGNEKKAPFSLKKGPFSPEKASPVRVPAPRGPTPLREKPIPPKKGATSCDEVACIFMQFTLAPVKIN